MTARQKEWYQKHRAEILIRRQATRDASPEYRAAAVARATAWRHAHPNEYRQHRRAANVRLLEKNPTYFTDWHLNNPEKSAAMHARRYANQKVQRRTLTGYLRSALSYTHRRQPEPVTITVADLFALLMAQEGRCAVSGVPMTHGPSSEKPTNISLDRIDITKGYVPGNVRLVCWTVNHMRNVMNDAELIAWCRAILYQIAPVPVEPPTYPPDAHIKQLKYAGTKRKDLSSLDLIDLFEKQAGRCLLTNCRMTYSQGKGTGNGTGWKNFVPTNASLDRIDNAKGYTLDNVRFVCLRVNLMRGVMTDEELRGWCRAILKRSE